MLLQRLDRPVTPDVDVMLSVLCDSRTADVSPATVSQAAVNVLRSYGVPAELASVRIAALNSAAIEALPGAGSLDALLNIQPSLLSASEPYVALSGWWPHTVVNARGMLLALGLGQLRCEQAGLMLQPAFFDVPPDFWSGEDAVFLSGDDGSGVFVWATPEAPIPAPAKGVVDAETQRLADRIATAAHPGWRAAS